MKFDPVWDVYDFYRTLRMNVYYFSYKLNNLTKINSTIEIILAITATSSTVAGFWFWDTGAGKMVWQWMLVISTVLAITKPISNLTEKIRKYEEILTAYRGLEHDLEKIKISINQDREYTKEHQNDYYLAIDRKGQIISKLPEIKLNNKLIEKFQRQVEKELPTRNFFIPKRAKVL